MIVFEFATRERDLLAVLLRRYPLLNPDYHRIAAGKDAKRLTEAQQMLADAMTEQHQANRRLVEKFLQEKFGAARETADGSLRVELTHAQADWLLEVLNDVRVGSWVRLGRPDPTHGENDFKVTVQNVADYGTMEFAGYLQTALLAALDGGQ